MDASVAALESNFWSVWQQFGRGPGCTLHERDGAVWFETPLTVANLADVPAGPPAPAGVEVHAVTPDRDFEPFLEYVATRWEVPPTERSDLAAIVRSFRVGNERSPTRAWLIVKDGKVLAKAGTHDTQDVVGLYGVATKPEARGLGLARLVCLTALAAARERGQRTAVLHSTPMAVTLYRALGFCDIAPFRLYAAPNSFHA